MRIKCRQWQMTFTLSGFMVAAAPVLALDAISIDMKKPADSGGFVGLGIGFATDYEGSDDSEALPAIFGRYNWASGRYVALTGTHEAGNAARLKANLISDDMSDFWELGPVLQYRLERDDVDNRRVDDMRDVDAATELGVFVGLKTGPWAASLTYAIDVSDEHDGSVVDLEGSYRMEVNNQFSLIFGASVSSADSDYMDTYFGVNADNVGTSGLPFFEADSDLKDVGFSLTANYDLRNSWGLVGNISYYSLLNDAEDSPLVDDEGDDGQLHAMLAVTYSF